MTRLAETGVSQLKKIYQRTVSGIRGHLDGVHGAALHGWVMLRGGGIARVGLYAQGALLAEVPADLHREDLAQAGFGDGRFGFAFAIDPDLREAIHAHGGLAEVRVLNRRAGLIGQHRFDRIAPRATPAQTADLRAQAGTRLTDAAETLQRLQTNVANRGGAQAVLNAPAPALTAHAPMFAETSAFNGRPLPEIVNGYADYVRYRYKLDTQFDFGGDADAALHFMHWYVQGYSPLRKGLRVPLSREALEHLNTPLPIGGVRFNLSRATWASIVKMPQFMQSLAFENRDWLLGLVYWWSVNQARALYCEDCLVPAHYIDFLATPSPAFADEDAPLTLFMERFLLENPDFGWIDRNDAADRRRLVAALMLLAVQRPDYLRYLPRATVADLLEGDLAQVLATLPGAPQVDLDGHTYAAVLRAQGFDLARGEFTTFTPGGHRIEAARLPALEADAASVDIQMIGPFEKASGLGQATRLSAQILAQTGYSVNPVNFGLDNPAPEGFSKVGKLSEFKRAKVNLIHLNAESIPLVYAYGPDVFSDAYNIGYFYWELDSPAACHHLALDMLDEVWVSTDYGVQIYQPHTDKPVVNAGMCYEDLPQIDKPAARDGVLARFGWDEGTFVFLVAFDSFSFVQRKNPLGVLKAFDQAFAAIGTVRLVIKTQNREKVMDPVQARIWDAVDAAVAADPRITVLNETLEYQALLELKAGCDCYISLHKSEGWGFGMIEAMNLGVPVVATAYSGNMDFCSDETAFLVDYDEVELEQDDYIFVLPGQKWAEPDVASAARQMRLVWGNDEMRAAKADAALQNVRANFSDTAIARRYSERLAQIIDQPGGKPTP